MNQSVNDTTGVYQFVDGKRVVLYICPALRAIKRQWLILHMNWQQDLETH